MLQGIAPFVRAALAGLALSLSPAPLLSQPTSEREDVVPVAASDQAMNAAIAEARRTLPAFLEVVEAPPPGVDSIAFKYPLGGWEHIWVTDVERRGGVLVGRLDNEPMQDQFRLGQPVEVPIDQVSDWAYRGADGTMRGHHTTRVILSRIDPAEAARIREFFGWKN